MLSLEIKEYLTDAAWLIGTIVSIGTGLVVVWKKFVSPILVEKLLKPLRQHIENISEIVGLAQDIRTVWPRLMMVVKAVLPNNGSSMPDALGRLEISLAAMQARFETSDSVNEAMLWNHPKAMFRCDEKGRNLFVNNAYARLLGASSEELLDLGWRSFIHTDDLLKYDEVWSKALHERRSSWFHIRMVSTEHVIYPLSIQFTLLRGAEGQFHGFLGMIDHHPDHEA